MEEHNIIDDDSFTAENARHVINLDENGFSLPGTNGKLKVRDPWEPNRLAPDCKEQVGVLGCVSASG